MENWQEADNIPMGSPDVCVPVKGISYPPKGCQATMQIWWDHAYNRTFCYVKEHGNPFSDMAVMECQGLVPSETVVQEFLAEVEMPDYCAPPEAWNMH